jgi:hypothetical protein
MILSDTGYRGICLFSFFLLIMTKKEKEKAKERAYGGKGKFE